MRKCGKEVRRGALVWFHQSALVREHHLGEGVIDHLKALTTVKPVGYEGVRPDPIPGWRSRGHWLGLPYHFGLGLARSLRLGTEDYLALGMAWRPDLRIRPTREGQPEFSQALLRTTDLGEGVFMAQAPTGFGKTVMALWLASHLHLQTIVLVPNRTLMRQWVRKAQELGVRAEDIGMVSGPLQQHDRPFVVAVLHNLFHRSYPAHVRSKFGLVIWDECHVLGAPMFSASMATFPARYRIGFTATPKRGDGCAPLFLNYFGEPSVKADVTAPMDATVYAVDFQLDSRTLRYFGRIGRAKRINHLAQLEGRQEALVSLILTTWRRGRDILVVGERIAQLEDLMERCLREIPEEEMGLYVGERHYPELGKEAKVPDAELDHIASACKVIFATYGKAKVGFDVPRLSVGIDATPRTEGEQLIGRIRRAHPNKPMPCWFTIRDVGCADLELQFSRRVQDFLDSGGVTLKNL